MDYSVIAPICITLLLIIILYLLYCKYGNKKVSKFSNADIEKSQRLFKETDGKLSFSAFKTHIDDADIVDYTDMKTLYNKS